VEPGTSPSLVRCVQGFENTRMKKIFSLYEWKFDNKIPIDKRIANVTIHLKYISLHKVENLTPGDRMQAINKHFKQCFSKLLAAGLYEVYEIIGTRSRPRGVNATLSVAEVKKIAKQNFVDSIFINSLQGGKKQSKVESLKYFCIKMIMAIQVESAKKGLQSYEERYVLIKAKTADDAYRKVESQAKEYQTPYLNSNGQMVRWILESLEDCYETDIQNSGELDQGKGIEVYSILKKRKLTKERYWNGKMGSPAHNTGLAKCRLQDKG
jgi:hypothetical protein